jgi:nucleoside-diphosphate-sugar epimerase
MNFYKSNKVLITGANGFVGSHLAERLIKEKLEVLGLCRNIDEIKWLEEKGVKIIKGDILDIEGFAEKIKGCDVIIHTAGWSGGFSKSKELAWKTNVEGTANMLASAKKCGIKKFIYVSSVAVYGMNDNLVIDEADETPTINELYPDSKIAAESLVVNSGIPYVIIRPGCIYGPRGEGWTLGIIKQIKSGFKLLGNDSGLINISFIDNFIDGLWSAIISDDALYNIFNINDDILVSYREFYTRFGRMIGINNLPKLPEWRVQLSRSLLFTVLRIVFRKPTIKQYVTHFRFNKSKFSIAKARDILKYNPTVDFNEGVYLTEKWLKEKSYLD